MLMKLQTQKSKDTVIRASLQHNTLKFWQYFIMKRSTVSKLLTCCNITRWQVYRRSFDVFLELLWTVLIVETCPFVLLVVHTYGVSSRCIRPSGVPFVLRLATYPSGEQIGFSVSSRSRSAHGLNLCFANLTNFQSERCLKFETKRNMVVGIKLHLILSETL